MSYLDRVKKIISGRPLVVGTMTGQRSLESQLRAARVAKVDLVELRLDTFQRLPKEVAEAQTFGRHLIEKIRERRFPILLTLRSHQEAGERIPARRRRTDSWRAAVLASLLPLVEMVDVEIDRTVLSRRLISLARKSGVNTILSHHNFKALPSPLKLKSLQRATRRLKGDVLKVAGRAATEDQLRGFLKWGLSVKNPRLVLIAMGSLGTRARILGRSFGSILTYGYLGKSAAPGQIPAGDLVRAIHSIYGQSR